MRTLRRRLWVVLAAFRCNREWLELLWLAAVHAKHGTKYTIPFAPNGIEFTAFLFPEGSRYGNSSATLPLDEDGARLGQRPPLCEPETTTTSSSVPTQQMWIDASRRGKERPR